MQTSLHETSWRQQHTIYGTLLGTLEMNRLF